MKFGKKKRKKPSLGIAIMWRVVAFVLGAWLIGMGYLTAMVARNVYLDYVDQVNAYVNRDGWFDYDSELDSFENYSARIRGIREFDPDTPELDLPLYDRYMELTEYVPRFHLDWPENAAKNSEQWSVTLYDNCERQIMGKNNYVYLTYRDYYNTIGVSAKDYLAGYTYINLERTECGRAMIEQWKGQKGYSDYEYILSESPRFTGYFDGGEFVLLDVDMDHHSFTDMPDWRSAYDGEITYEGETVVIYPAEMVYDRCDIQVSVMNRQWELENLADHYARSSVLETDSTKEYEKMLGKRDRFEWDDFQELWNNENLFESVITRSGTYLNEDRENCEFVTVLRVQPMRIAVAMLAEVYLMTFIPLALILFFFCRRIRRELINPLGHILGNPDLERAVPLYRMVSKYWEPQGMLEIFNQAQEHIHQLKKENTQLTTALDYAHNAEENRRRMVSNITHELKTPLAVIHSYAEGLKEGIAADKQQHYLNVILEEAQRMDGMVLEMLDLSRLEAGKVRLASDRFGLLELTRRVVDKMDLLIEQKELKVEYVWDQEVEITADEGRMLQALTNLVSNAIKYSPRGGTVYISVAKVKDTVMFAIENESEALSEETLTNIWESFYRADSSRTEKGTGLGLPITKAIIELHGGTCHVSNTATGVEFKFNLP